MTNQCQHGQLARVCLICEQVAEIERLTATVAGLRESANLRVRYHSAELADVTAERDEAREEVARLRDARVQFSGADAAEIERLRDQLHLAEVARAAQVEGLVQGVAGWRERANQLDAQVAALTAERDEAREQVEIYAAERDEARAAWSNRTRELERMEAQVAALEVDAGRYRWLKPRLFSADFDYNENGIVALVFEMPPNSQIWADCDMTMDAARKGEA